MSEILVKAIALNKTIVNQCLKYPVPDRDILIERGFS